LLMQLVPFLNLIGARTYREANKSLNLEESEVSIPINQIL
jgi:hypothetical protein